MSHQSIKLLVLVTYEETDAPTVHVTWKVVAEEEIMRNFSRELNTVLNALIENSIQLLTEIPQDVFFSNELPSYMSCGGIGFFIGHEDRQFSRLVGDED